VFVVKPDSTVELRPVRVAAAEGDQTAITRGVAAGERVVIDGQTRLTPGMRTVERAQPPADGAAAPAAGARS
jgi:multidrug efflux system membrane fusion protein